MVGAVAGFKQQNAASGLPLRLLPEELALALDSGWARGYRLRGEEEGSGFATGAADPFLGDTEGGDGDGGRGGEGGGGAGDGGGEARAEDGGDGEERKEDPSSSSWREALAQGTHLTLAAAAPESLRVYFDHDSSSEAPQRELSRAAVAASHAVFRDLHARGFCLTPGANFGAHWLAYPSDPMLYHAQLCVRVCSGVEKEDEEEEKSEGRKGCSSSAASAAPLCPTLLAAASRGAHAARKHLLLAYPSGGGGGTVHYLTIAPEAGFG